MNPSSHANLFLGAICFYSNKMNSPQKERMEQKMVKLQYDLQQAVSEGRVEDAGNFAQVQRREKAGSERGRIGKIGQVKKKK